MLSNLHRHIDSSLLQDIATCETSLAEAITQDASSSSARLSVDALKAKKAEIEAEAAAALVAKDFEMVKCWNVFLTLSFYLNNCVTYVTSFPSLRLLNPSILTPSFLLTVRLEAP